MINRNGYKTYGGGNFGYNQGYKTVSSGMGTVNNMRAPLYPIGPTLTQP